MLITSIIIMSLLLSVSIYIISAALLFTYVGFSLFQTAMMNAISLTLTEQETGVGMGLFNLVATLSGAVGTAVAGRILDGKWFDFNLSPIVSNPKGYGYSNIFLLFSIIIALGGVMYLYSFRKIKIKHEFVKFKND